jgi:acetylornithine deacetylase/succinyl-diaminopimelate desuccinylase-like protein
MHEIYQYVIDQIDNEVIPVLFEYIKIPSQSRDYDPDWNKNGLQDEVCFLAMVWASTQGLENVQIHFLKEPERTPCILITVDCPEVHDPSTILLYGHLDKQPPLTENWSPGLGPYTPIIKGDKLYGRGSTDDGYAFFSCIAMLKALQKYKCQSNRFVMMFETDEESGSKDLLYFLEKNKDLVGNPSVVVCLDSGAINYEHFFTTNSLRGFLEMKVKVAVSSIAVHSGDASGIIPDSFRIARKLLESLERSDDQGILLDEFYTDIPSKDYLDAYDLVKKLGDQISWDFPFLPGVQPVVADKFEQYINVNWKPAMCLVGIDGIPSLTQSGNVVRPYTTLLLSFRLPPNLDSAIAEKALIDHFNAIEKPYNAKVDVEVIARGNGFVSGPLTSELRDALDKASQKFMGKEMLGMCVGGSIPFMNELAKFYPNAKFLVTGVDGPNSNMHAPDECLDIPFLKKFLCCLTYAFNGQLE